MNLTDSTPAGSGVKRMNRNNYYYRQYEVFLTGSRYAPRTIQAKKRDVKNFLLWIDKDIRDITETDIYRYHDEYLQTYTGITGKPLTKQTINDRLTTVCQFFTYLYRNEHLLTNPAEHVVFDRKQTKKQKKIFTAEEINIFLDSIPVGTPVLLRDRALFELMYSSGLRGSEPLNLETEDVQLRSRVLLIRQGKGRKDRYVPFSAAAQRFLTAYLTKGRDYFVRRVNPAHRKYLFLTYKGKMSTGYLFKIFKKYLEQAGLEERGFTLHSIRFATATHLLEAGANIRYVQELLGHEQIDTTMRYARPSEENIKKVYRMYHPRENELYEEIDSEYLKHLEAMKTKRLYEKEYRRKRKEREKAKKIDKKK